MIAAPVQASEAGNLVRPKPASGHAFLFAMDPYPTLNLATETSLLLMEELLARGHRVFWAEMEDVLLAGDEVRVNARAVRGLEPLQLEPATLLAGDALDAVLIRKDPPFDRNYLHLTQLLDRLPARVVQANPARALREFNEKLAPLRFAQFVPPSLTSMSAAHLAAFVREHGRAVAKPLDDCSGRGIARLDADDPELEPRLQALSRDAHGQPRYLQVQAFLPAIAAGDKRIYLVDGEVAGIVNRVPAPGNWLGNIHQGATVEAAGLGAEEEACLAVLRPFLRQHGLLLVGADFIGGRLTELNITSPSAIRQINAVSGMRVERRIVDALVRQIEARAATSSPASNP